ncbi:MAG: DUF3347 domain-containing protein [Thermoanaerobaculia bacterium]|nr:DUF3347 domain-containing protein [Thermoanaerobaculia bacterium]
MVFVVVMAVLVVNARGAEAASSFEKIIKHYEPIREALVDDSTAGVAEHARRIVEQTAKLAKNLDARHGGVAAERVAELRALVPEIKTAAEQLATAQGIEAVREAFYGLTQPLVRYRTLLAKPAADAQVAYCPMARKSWLQPGGKLGNPYYGQSMAECGSFVEEG